MVMSISKEVFSWNQREVQHSGWRTGHAGSALGSEGLNTTVSRYGATLVLIFQNV